MAFHIDPQGNPGYVALQSDSAPTGLPRITMTPLLRLKHAMKKLWVLGFYPSPAL